MFANSSSFSNNVFNQQQNQASRVPADLFQDLKPSTFNSVNHSANINQILNQYSPNTNFGQNSQDMMPQKFHQELPSFQQQSTQQQSNPLAKVFSHLYNSNNSPSSEQSNDNSMLPDIKNYIFLCQLVQQYREKIIEKVQKNSQLMGGNINLQQQQIQNNNSLNNSSSLQAPFDRITKKVKSFEANSLQPSINQSDKTTHSPSQHSDDINEDQSESSKEAYHKDDKKKKPRKVKIPELDESDDKFIKEKFGSEQTEEKALAILEMKIRKVLEEHEKPMNVRRLKQIFYKHEEKVQSIIAKVIINKKYYRRVLGLGGEEDDME